MIVDLRAFLLVALIFSLDLGRLRCFHIFLINDLYKHQIHPECGAG